MANRFKKSIGAVEAESDELMRGQTSIEQGRVDANADMSSKKEDNIEHNMLYNTQYNILDNIPNKLQNEEQRGKAVTIYLSWEVTEALNKVSAQKQISKSKLVDSILKQVFTAGQ